MGEATMTFGRKCKIVGKTGLIMLIIGIVGVIFSVFLSLILGKNIFIVILIILTSICVTAGGIMFPLLFVGQHLMCLGRIEMNTRIMFENQEKLNKKNIVKS